MDVIRTLEEQFQDFAIDDEDACPSEEFTISEVNCEEEKALAEKCQYIRDLMDDTGLEILKKGLVCREYEERKERGLFNLFLNQSFLEGVRLWTNEELLKREKKKASKELFNAYIGLELAMSVAQLNDIHDFWSTEMFLGNADFKRVLSRNTFTNICSSLKFYPEYDHAVAVLDPLWHSRIMLQHFMKNAAFIAVPKGCSALDENTIRCKARTGARSYMKSKPIKFGIRFYAVVGWKHAYLHSIWDNGSGNKTNVAPAEAYCRVFRDLRGPYDRSIDSNLVNPKSASALWCLQMAHQTKMLKNSNKRRMMVIDNFYTRHLLGLQLRILSDDDIRIIGTVRFNNVDSVNRPLLKEAISTMSGKPRGSWLLVQSFSKPIQPGQEPQVVEEAGFVVFKDRSFVVFYTNDLAGTPTLPIQDATEEAIQCVHGLASLKRWMGNETFHQTELQVPACIVAYNVFMNAVDRFDQMRSTHMTARREKRVPMSIFTFLLDAAIHNAFALLKEIDPENASDMKSFKRTIAEQLVSQHLRSKPKKRKVSEMEEAKDEDDEMQGIGDILSTHMILENVDRKSTQCHLCNIMTEGRKEKTSIYSCIQCHKGFHVNCFTLYHSREALKVHRPLLRAIIRDRDGSSYRKYRRKRPNLCCSTLSNTRLPFGDANL